jgi:transposase InsO family protein
MLSEKIARIHTDSRETYGAPRIHFELRTLGVRCARKRVARLMREKPGCLDAVGVGGRLAPLCAHTPSVLPRLRTWWSAISPSGPRTACGSRTSRTFVLDTYSRKVVGWSMANNLRSEIVLDALNMAIYTRRPQPGLIHHSDRGSQYTSVEFGSRLREEGLLPSMGSVADAYDNAMAESFVSTLKRELIHRHSWPNRQAARTAIFEYIEGFYNTRRRHSALGHLSPSEYEEVRLGGGAVA